MRTRKDNWAGAVTKIVKTELIKKDITYGELSKRLANIGINESEASIKTKMSRGTFRATWFLQILHVIGVTEITFDDSYIN